VAYASVSELNGIVEQLKQTAQSMAIRSRKDAHREMEDGRCDQATDAGERGGPSSAICKQRWLETIAQLNNAPEDLGASFKLYRQTSMRCMTCLVVVEAAGAFGSKDEFQSLGNDMTGLESARRTLGERVQKLAASKEDELTRLRGQVKKLSAAPPPPPQKIVVDDTVLPKKPAKKKVAKPKPPATTIDTSAEYFSAELISAHLALG